MKWIMREERVKKIITAILIFIGIIFLIGCANRAEPEQVSELVSTITISDTPKPTQTYTPQPTPTETANPCFQQVDFETMSGELPGQLIFSNKDYTEIDYYYDWRSFEKHLFATKQQPYHRYTISPDRKWIAYLSDSLLLVEGVFGEIQYQLNTDNISEESITLVGWINNETIILDYMGNNFDDLHYLVSVNPFTGRVKKIFLLDFPDITKLSWEWERHTFWASIASYDPTIRYVTYIADSDETAIWDFNLILYDTWENRIITRVNNFGLTYISPIWKNDGSGFYFAWNNGSDVYSNCDELYFMNKDGEINKLTYHSGEENVFIHLFDAKLSPNEKFIAYGLNAYDENGNYYDRGIQILNLQTREIQNSCIPIEYFVPIIWSPDNRFLAFHEELDDRSIRTWIMDIEHQTVSVVDENAYPVLWVEENH
jgi:hypothetical protein